MKTFSTLSSGLLFVLLFILSTDLIPADKKKPSFSAEYISTDLVEITIMTDTIMVFNYIYLKSLPDDDGIQKTIYNIERVKIPIGNTVRAFRLKDFELLNSAGKLSVEYKLENTNTISDTIIVLRSLHTIYTDAGFLFAYGKDGIIKCYPNIAVAVYSKQFSWSTFFAELNLNAIAPVDSTTNSKNIYEIFTKGGSVLDFQIGSLLYPWYKEWEYEVFQPFIGYGIRTFNNKEIEYRQRWIAGVTIDVFPLTGDLEDGYLDIGYAYDRFWDLGDSLKSKFNPNRLFVKAHVDFTMPATDKLASLELKADLPSSGHGYGSLGIIFIVSLDVPRLLGNIFDSATNIWGKTETK